MVEWDNRKRRLDCISRVVAWGCGQPESGRGCYVWLATLAHDYLEQGPGTHLEIGCARPTIKMG